MRSIFVLTTLAAAVHALDLQCPDVPGESVTFDIEVDPELVTIPVAEGLCILTLAAPNNGAPIPIARSYMSRNWERAGGGFAAKLETWVCDEEMVCQSTLPVGNDYVLQSRVVTDNSYRADVARFLEFASFGATRESIASFPGIAAYVDEQIHRVPPTFHREVHRRQLNPIWRVDKPEFGALLDPCQKNTVWTRKFLNTKDVGKSLEVRRVDSRWEVSIDGHVRTMSAQLRFRNTKIDISEGSFQICSNAPNLQRGHVNIRINGLCRTLLQEDLTIDFPTSYMDASVVTGTVGRLSVEDQWQLLPDGNYLKINAIARTRCSGLPLTPGEINPPIFIQTNTGEWLQHLPRPEVLDNSLDSPLSDGGYSNWSNGRVRYCSTVPRSIFNEASCFMADTIACSPWSQNSTDVEIGRIVCGSPNEVANVPSLGDGYTDIATATTTQRALDRDVPRDTTPVRIFGNQREYIWSQIALTSDDQLRQRVAWYV